MFSRLTSEFRLYRVVMSLLFSTDPTMTINPLLRSYQSRINQVFYGNGAL